MNGGGVTAMDENGEDIKSPIKRLGSTRKLLIFNNIRLQLNEQLRCLDVRMESQVSLIQELQDFFRRRGEVELDYSKSLDKLAKSLQIRHKEQKQKREQWPMFSSYACWQQLVNQTKSLSKDHAALSEIYTTHLVARLQTVIEDVQRIYKKCREIGYETHEEILRVLHELHTTMKTYHSYQTECKAAEAKLRTAETQRMKIQQTIPKEKLERSKKYRLIEKEMLKRKSKYTDARLKALKARNEYQLCLEASNTTIHKYFVEDLSDLIDCMDLGFHSMVSRALLMHVTADQGRCRAVLHNADILTHTVHAMDSRADKQKFLEQYHGAFMIPKRLEFQGQLDDEVEPELQKALSSEMEARLVHLDQRVRNLRMESEEIWKTLEAAEKNLLEILNTKDYDSSSHFGDSTTQSAKPENLTIKLKSDKQEMEEFYITKIREYILGTSRIARLDSKAEHLRSALIMDSTVHSCAMVSSNVPKRKRIGRMNMTGQPKLFGGSLEEYLEVMNEGIPLIMRSCIRVVNLYGLHHQGIFRVSGSQVEISNFREGFERGEDPLADTTDASDINSVAGVLKLYLRELREPLFPIIYFDHLVSLSQLETKQELVMGIKKFLLNLPRCVVIVIRYLFAFLNHLSEYSDENMMDAYNLAICFGPTLMPAPEDKDQVQYQNQVNDLIKNMIMFHDELFPKDLGGAVYEKYISNEPFDDVGDSPTEQITEDPDSEVYPSEDESDTMEATAQFDFNARSNRELSFRKGDLVVLRKQVSNDWWQGTIKGKDGLIPDKYISLKIKDEDRDKSSDHLKSSSSEESVRKRRPSGNISVNSQLSIFSQTSIATDSVASVESPVFIDNQKLNPNNGQLQLYATVSGTQTVDIPHPINKSAPVVITSDTSPCHYESVDSVKSKYSYHEEPHSFENCMEFLEDVSHFHYENKKSSEPIYAEPSKNPQPVANASPSPARKISESLTGSMLSSSNQVDDLTIDENALVSMHFDGYDGVTLRNVNKNEMGEMASSSISSPKLNILSNRKSESAAPSQSTADTVDSSHINGKSGKSPNTRHSDTELFKDTTLHQPVGSALTTPLIENRQSQNITDQSSNHRKYHSKSFSLSENRIVAPLTGVTTSGLNVFQQNRDLWEKRTEMSSQHSLTTPRILSRHRIAPDLVMDLPVTNKDTPTRGSRESVDSTDDSVGNKIKNGDTAILVDTEDMTSAERFAAPNQCTLKKNERYSVDSFSSSSSHEMTKKEVKLGRPVSNDKPKAEVRPQENSSIVKKADETTVKTHLNDVLHIDEDDASSSSQSTVSHISASLKDLHKSPIPLRNTQKFVSQFADLHLTGGCLSTPPDNDSIPIVSTSSSSSIPSTFSSFKPQVKVKPQLMKKPLVLPPATPESIRRNQQ